MIKQNNPLNLNETEEVITTTEVTTNTINIDLGEKELKEIVNSFLNTTVIKIIPLLSNGNPSKNRYIKFPLNTKYLQPGSIRGGIFRALRYSYTKPPYIDFQPTLIIMDEDGQEYQSFVQYYATISNYDYFCWINCNQRVQELKTLLEGYISQLNFLSGETSNGILSIRFEELKKEFEEKIQKFAEPWYYTESEWNVKPTESMTDN